MIEETDKSVTVACVAMLLYELDAGFSFSIEHFEKPILFYSKRKWTTETGTPRYVKFVAKITGLETCDLEHAHGKLPFLTAGEDSVTDAITDILNQLREWKESQKDFAEAKQILQRLRERGELG